MALELQNCYNGVGSVQRYRYLFVISTSVIYCLGRFVPEMTYYVSSGTLNINKLKLTNTRTDHTQTDTGG